jgi:Ca2+-binding EF-hand superfamily protein
MVDKFTKIKDPRKLHKPKKQLTEEQLLEVKEAFNVFDSEQSGGLDARELKAALSALNVKISKDEIRQIYSEFGKDIRDKISQEEFFEIVTPRLPDRHTKDYIKMIFNYFDLDKNEKISIRNLKKIAQEIGENLSDEELKEILEEADKDNDGFIGFDDFYRIMRKRGDDPLEDWSSDEENL